jgi:GntR family transcriptional regulator
MVLDQGPTPLYYQLKNILKSKILSNELKGHERLPSEAELCVEYNVSRATVRQALSELMKDGLIYRDRGRGTFVTEGAGLKRLSLKGTIENLIAAGEGTRIKVLDYKEVTPPPSVSKVLQLGMAQKVFQLEILRFISKGPFGYSFIYFPPGLGKMIAPKELNETCESDHRCWIGRKCGGGKSLHQAKDSSSDHRAGLLYTGRLADVCDHHLFPT